MSVVKSVRLRWVLTAVSWALWGHRNEALLFWGRWKFQLCIFSLPLMCCLFFGPQLWCVAGCVIIPTWWAHRVNRLCLHTGVERCNPPGIHTCLCVCVNDIQRRGHVVDEMWIWNESACLKSRVLSTDSIAHLGFVDISVFIYVLLFIIIFNFLD